MKKKELQEIRTKTKKELLELIRKTQEKLVKLRLEKATGKLKDVHLPQKVADELAQLKTILREKELANENI
ncbi:MAG: 50S ribosomal protein L29 [Microgenomates group bacterium]